MLADQQTIRTDLDYPLVKFSLENKQDWWTIRDAVRGVQIFGGIGSGKSSGSGKTFAKTFLKNGFGGLVLCAKPDERENWQQLARETGRQDDLIIFGEDTEYQFNPLEYELTRKGKGAGEVFNLSYLFMEIYKMGNRFSGSGGGGDSERYWDNALKRCMNRMIQLLKLAGEEVSIANMIQLLSHAPKEEEVDELAQMTEEEIEGLGKDNYCFKCVMNANSRHHDTKLKEECDFVNNYFLRDFARLDDRSKPIIMESFLGLAEPFTSGILKKHFASGTNLYPETTFEGKIIILDFPVKEYLASGVYAQGIFKLLWQQAAERRNPNEDLLPVFLWVDESHYSFLITIRYFKLQQEALRHVQSLSVKIFQIITVLLGVRNPKAQSRFLTC